MPKGLSLEKTKVYATIRILGLWRSGRMIRGSAPCKLQRYGPEQQTNLLFIIRGGTSAWVSTFRRKFPRTENSPSTPPRKAAMPFEDEEVTIPAGSAAKAAVIAADGVAVDLGDTDAMTVTDGLDKIEPGDKKAAESCRTISMSRSPKARVPNRLGTPSGFGTSPESSIPIVPLRATLTDQADVRALANFFLLLSEWDYPQAESTPVAVLPFTREIAA
jgi:hypothetical protein